MMLFVLLVIVIAVMIWFGVIIAGVLEFISADEWDDRD
jgi:hypothetical protein